MKKKLFAMFVCAALVGAFSLSSLWAMDAPKDMEIKVPDGATATKAPVKFSHEKHKANECKTCHHKLDTDPKAYKCSNKGCHDDVADKANEKGYYKAFHDMNSPNSCLGCHKKAKAEGKNPPMGCPVCHPAS